MKKILTVGLILAAVLSLGFMGCKNNADELPGTWTKTIEDFRQDTKTAFGTGTVTFSDQTCTFEVNQPANITNSTTLTVNHYRSSIFVVSLDEKFTGFKATVESNAEGGCGLIFNQSNNGDIWSFYEIYFDPAGWFIIYQVIDDVSTTIKDWTKNEIVKTLTAGSKINVLVYTAKDGTIIVKFNDIEVATIKSPVLKSGRVGVVNCVGYADVQRDTPIKTVFTFKEFQY